MRKKEIEHALEVTRANIGRFGSRFPHVSQDGRCYELNDNDEWTNGFWSGILWLCYEYSGDEAFRQAAVSTVASFRERLDRKTELDHHDIGFLYSLSSKAMWIVERDQPARTLTLEAADHLMKRWREKSGIFQAWGPENDPKNGGRIIIDCLMNLPLLFWASEQTGDPLYRERAELHLRKSRRFLIRGDDSSYHTFYFDPETGDAVRGGTQQGYRDGSTWTRGHAWGIYGFALAYRYLRKPEYLDTALRLARYFLDRLPDDRVVYWDFDVPVTDGTIRDSSASAIAVTGLIEIADLMAPGDPEIARLLEAADRILEALAARYSTSGDPEAEGLLKHGSYYVHGGLSTDDYMIWGDYYYLEALMRRERGVPGYWYEKERG